MITRMFIASRTTTAWWLGQWGRQRRGQGWGQEQRGQGRRRQRHEIDHTNNPSPCNSIHRRQTYNSDSLPELRHLSQPSPIYCCQIVLLVHRGRWRRRWRVTHRRRRWAVRGTMSRDGHAIWNSLAIVTDPRLCIQEVWLRQYKQ